MPEIHTVEVNGRRITLKVDPETDMFGQFRVAIAVDGPLTGKDVELTSVRVTDKSER
jgi:hypothetical protein